MKPSRCSHGLLIDSSDAMQRCSDESLYLVSSEQDQSVWERAFDAAGLQLHDKSVEFNGRSIAAKSCCQLLQRNIKQIVQVMAYADKVCWEVPAV